MGEWAHLVSGELGGLEATPGFEPGDKGFAGPCLTTWPRRLGELILWHSLMTVKEPRPLPAWAPPLRDEKKPGLQPGEFEFMERETGIEPATSTLARLHSTAELLPLSTPKGERQFNNRGASCQHPEEALRRQHAAES